MSVVLNVDGMDGRRDIPHVPDYTFNWQAFFIVLFSFILVYECIMLCYSVRIKNISLKEIMLE